MKLFTVVGGYPGFINDLLEVWKDKYHVKVFNKHQNTERIGFLKRKFRAARNIFNMRGREINENYDWSDITFVEWAAYALRILCERVDGSTPIVTRLHRYELFSPTLEKINFSVVSKVVVVSDFIKQELLKRIPELNRKLITMPYGIQTKNWSIPNEKQRTKNIGVIAQLIPRKRIDLIMRAIKPLDDISLHIAGGGRLLKNLRRLARELKIDGRTSFYGQIPHQEILRWLIDKDIIINASESEGSPVSVIEAMMMGVIPLVRNWPGAEEFYPSEFILPFRDQEFVNSLPKKIVEFYTLSKAEAEKKRKTVKTIAHEKFAFNKQVERYDKLFSKTLFDQTQQ